VHLTDYPVANAREIDAALNAHMELVMNHASLGRAARAKAGIKVRQPLPKAFVVVPDEAEGAAVAALAEHIKDELNVKDVDVVRDLAEVTETHAVAGDDRYSVAVVTELSDDLIAEGFARELVRRLQMMRRSAGLEISDHIVVFYHGSSVLQDVFVTHADYIRQETLSVELRNEAPAEGSFVQSLKLDGHELAVGVARAT
jgi:isoleucyl-tRNA synthetase